jgi:ABC-type multidrug transport system fused ATPase/permease subunit
MRVLLEEMSTSTIISVAHRLHNITHFHRVIVIGKEHMELI